MKPIIRSILTPIAIAASAWALGSLFIRQQEKKSTQENASESVAFKDNILAMRTEAIDAAKKAYKVMLEAERIAYVQEKKESDFAELAELSHEVRMLRIDLEHRTALSAIDKKYPPPYPVQEAAPAPEP